MGKKGMGNGLCWMSKRVITEVENAQENSGELIDQGDGATQTSRCRRLYDCVGRDGRVEGESLDARKRIQG